MRMTLKKTQTWKCLEVIQGFLCTSGSCDGEQEVPFGSHTSQETSMDTADKHKELQGMDQRRKMWSPSFGCPPLFEQQFHREDDRSLDRTIFRDQMGLSDEDFMESSVGVREGETKRVCAKYCSRRLYNYSIFLMLL
ncbi:unnamed protein product [Pleuronectes platessa]|uniref:Uncharacterized protein n=1 Tax=Pleuronectes platessa TaxID=8262 RepID=A0A9N7THG5_PLEPL|nr:unnamed protein product [Pleuronectes platessa]